MVPIAEAKNLINKHILDFCAEECNRQRVGLKQLAWMLQAWTYAVGQSAKRPRPDLGDIMALGMKVEKEVNKDAWRRHTVIVYGAPDFPHPDEIKHRMFTWRELLLDMTPEEAYRTFEEIHPFLDGNGRVGKIIYNWLNGSLEKPVFPPNFWGEVP